MDALIAEIKERVNIVDLVERDNVQLKGGGATYRGGCPFHESSSGSSFAVYPDSGTWKCFNSTCKGSEGGDIYSYVQLSKNMDFREAKAHLAKFAGIELEEKKDEHRRLKQLMNTIQAWYSEMLHKDARTGFARDYLKERGLSSEFAYKYQLGYAPKNGNLLLAHLKKKGFTQKEINQSGILNRKETYPLLNGRLTFAIQDQYGQIVGFAGRSLKKNPDHKYINTRENPLFRKSKTLYGLYWSKSAIRKKREIVITEGYFDVITAHTNGYENTCAVMGTAFTKEHVLSLPSSVEHIVMCFDADAIDTTLKTVRNTLQVKSDKQSVFVKPLVDGDPDDLIRANPQAWGGMPIADGLEYIVLQMLPVDTLSSQERLAALYALTNDWLGKLPPTLQEAGLQFTAEKSGISVKQLLANKKPRHVPAPAKKGQNHWMDSVEICPALTGDITELCLLNDIDPPTESDLNEHWERYIYLEVESPVGCVNNESILTGRQIVLQMIASRLGQANCRDRQRIRNLKLAQKTLISA